MFWQILCISNTILNVFVSLVLGIVCYTSIKRIREQKKKINSIKK